MCGPSDGKEVKDVFGRPGTHGNGCPAAGQHLETGQLSRRYIAGISLNVTLNNSQPNQPTSRTKILVATGVRLMSFCEDGLVHHSQLLEIGPLKI